MMLLITGWTPQLANSHAQWFLDMIFNVSVPLGSSDLQYQSWWLNLVKDKQNTAEKRCYQNATTFKLVNLFRRHILYQWSKVSKPLDIALRVNYKKRSPQYKRSKTSHWCSPATWNMAGRFPHSMGMLCTKLHRYVQLLSCTCAR